LAPTGRIIVIAAVAAAALLVAYAIYESTNVPGTVTSPVPSKFTVNGRTYTFTYIATTYSERLEGLMNKEVTNTTTMLFAFPSSAEWQFWMLNTNTSLDMIWVNATGNSGRVVYIVTSAQPCYDSNTCTVYTPAAPANFVIEARAGFVSANGIANGASISFSAFRVSD
jgi:uncharacterized protein